MSSNKVQMYIPRRQQQGITRLQAAATVYVATSRRAWPKLWYHCWRRPHRTNKTKIVFLRITLTKLYDNKIMFSLSRIAVSKITMPMRYPNFAEDDKHACSTKSVQNCHIQMDEHIHAYIHKYNDYFLWSNYSRNQHVLRLKHVRQLGYGGLTRQVGLVWGLADIWRSVSAFIEWTGWTLAMASPRWQHHKQTLISQTVNTSRKRSGVVHYWVTARFIQ